jgi:1-acyl-sn-glycerol-3-phosphate acyltransferase
VIPARKSPAFTRFFAGDAERRLEGAFDAIVVRGLGVLGSCVKERPTLVVTNHTAWWDPLVALFVSVRVLGADAYAMMDAANLARLPFFGRVGAFGVDLTDPADGARAIRYAAKLLAGDNRLVWLFAQGREVPVTARPLGFRPGSGEIARVARSALVVPGALRYEMGGTPRPTLWMSFGEPAPRFEDARAATRAHEDAVTTELDRIDRAIVSGDRADFVPLRERREDVVFRLAQWALARVTGGTKQLR